MVAQRAGATSSASVGQRNRRSGGGRGCMEMRGGPEPTEELAVQVTDAKTSAVGCVVNSSPRVLCGLWLTVWSIAHRVVHSAQCSLQFTVWSTANHVVYSMCLHEEDPSGWD